MNKQTFINEMRLLFQVWDGTDNADDILTDVCNTIGHDVFKLESKDLPNFVIQCRHENSEIAIAKYEAWLATE